MRKSGCFYLLVIVLLTTSVIKWDKVSGFDELGYPGINFYLSNDSVSFRVTDPSDKPIDAAQPVGVSVLSNLPEWQVHYQASPLKGPEGEIPPDRILISSPYSEGFEPMNVPRLVARGSIMVPDPVEVSHLRFRFLPSPNDRPGEYTGIISSPEGLPLPNIPINVVVELYTSISLSSDKISFSVTTGPGEYEADEPIELTVESNNNRWVVMARATPLMGLLGSGAIPPNRIFFKREGGIFSHRGRRAREDGEYMKMSGQVVVAEGRWDGTGVEATLKFKVKTEWKDKAGTYSGKVIFTCQPR